MSKIPDWAVRITEEINLVLPYAHVQETIARALVAAERRGIESAAKVADEAGLVDSSLWAPGSETHAYYDGQEYSARTIASAIRQLGEVEGG